MSIEYTCTALIGGKLTPVIVDYEMDGYKPIIYGIFGQNDEDWTLEISQPEFDRIYSELMTKAQEGEGT